MNEPLDNKLIDIEEMKPLISWFDATRKELQGDMLFCLECARKIGAQDKLAGVTIPPVEFCEETGASKELKKAWMEGWSATETPITD